MPKPSKEQTQAYIEELIEVGHKHGFTLGLEDHMVAFIVQAPSEERDQWLRDAWIDDVSDAWPEAPVPPPIIHMAEVEPC